MESENAIKPRCMSKMHRRLPIQYVLPPLRYTHWNYSSENDPNSQLVSKSEKIDWNRYSQIVIIMTFFKKIFILVTFFLHTSFCAELFDFGIFENFVANGKIFEAEVQIIHRLREIRGLLKSVSRYERVFWLLYKVTYYRLILMLQHPGRGHFYDLIWA